MEFGDIIYFVLLLIFMILGFFNDSRKKKQQQQAEAQKRQERESDTFFDIEEVKTPDIPSVRKTKPLPPPVAVSAKNRYDNFQSSTNLVSIHEAPSSMSTYSFDYDLNSYEEMEDNSADTDDDARKVKVGRPMHPLLKSLRSEAGAEELKKGLIYGEILQRKY